MKKSVLCFMMAVMFNINLFSHHVVFPPFVDLLKYKGKQVPSLSSVRMWGWSKDGKVAYSVEKFVEGRGGIVITAAIFDLVKNRIVWKGTIDLLAFNDEDTAYNRFYQDYKNICARNGIDFLQVEYNNFPIRYNDQVYNLIIETVAEEEEAGHMGDKLSSYKVILKNQKKEKVIQNKNNVWAISVSPYGYFISPYENRALIVIGETVVGFDDLDVVFYFIGCQL
jgi:hypothetical protein